MKTLELPLTVTVATPDELDTPRRQLVEAAMAATLRSYAPYSNFKVGAALRLDNGQVLTGTNQENVAYPSGTCAERTVAYYAHSMYPHARFEALAIAARDTQGEIVARPISPCGACRQALLEFEQLGGRPVEILLVGCDRVYIVPSVASLLPLAFTEFD